jgi:molecular chaperone Hsp33
MYECNCNKERFERGLKTLGKDELKDILFTDKKAEITCNFCNKKYTFNEEDLAKLIDEIPN